MTLIIILIVLALGGVAYYILKKGDQDNDGDVDLADAKTSLKDLKEDIKEEVEELKEKVVKKKPRRRPKKAASKNTAKKSPAKKTTDYYATKR